MVQGGVVGFFWEVNAGILRDGEEIDWKLLTLSMVTSGVDVLVIKLPSAVLAANKKKLAGKLTFRTVQIAL